MHLVVNLMKMMAITYFKNFYVLFITRDFTFNIIAIKTWNI